MGIWDKLTGELIDIIEWVDSTQDTIAWRFERYQKEIKNGAQLTVRESQVAVFVNEGQIADIFSPGRYQLTTQNLPILTTLKGWKYGFNSPFKAEVYFINTKQFTDQKWGTKSPIILNDPRFGMFEVRSFGTYAFRVSDAKKFVQEILGTSGYFNTEDIAGQLRSLVVTRFSDTVGESQFTAEMFAAKLNELSEALHQVIHDDFNQYGIDLTKFLIENISMPEEIKKEIFELSRLEKIDLSKLTQLKTAKAIEKSAENHGEAGAGLGMGMGVGMGYSVAQQMSQQMGQIASSPNTQGTPGSVPPPLPNAVQFFVAIEGQQQGPFPLDQLQTLVQSGKLSRETLVWKQGMDQWKAADQVTDLNSFFQSVPPPLPK